MVEDALYLDSKVSVISGSGIELVSAVSGDIELSSPISFEIELVSMVDEEEQ